MMDKWRSVFAIATLMLLSSCTRQIAWNEEVRLADNSVVILHRTAKPAPFGEIGGSGGWENEGMTVEIQSPSSRSNRPPVWDFPFVPMIFDRDARTSEWFVVATFYSCRSWYDLGRPKLPYVEYRARGNTWEKVSLSAEVVGREANVLTAIRMSGEGSLVRLAEKRSRMNESTIAPEYRHVVSKWATNC